MIKTQGVTAVSPLFSIDPELGHIVHEGYYHAGKLWVGVQRHGWEEDEIAWDHDEEGAWAGRLMPNQSVPLELRPAIVSQVLIDVVDDIWLCPPGLNYLTYKLLSSAKGGSAESFVVRCDIAGQAVQTLFNEMGKTATQNFDLRAGSYLVGTRLIFPPAETQLPPDYAKVTGYDFPAEFYYLENGGSHPYDPEYGVGRWPTNPETAVFLNGRNVADERRRIIAGNLQKDRTAWTSYVTTDVAQNGDWSLTKIQCGAGAWSCAADFKPYPGMALMALPGAAPEGGYHVGVNNESQYAVNFDPMARAVTCIGRTPSGRLLVGGLRATPSGNNTAVWEHLPDGSLKLLGTDPDPSDLACECALRNHAASDIRESPSGEIHVLSLCSGHILNEQEPILTKRMIPVPSPEGQPGGRCLRFDASGSAFRFCEWFKVPSSYDEEGITFYNRMMIFLGNRISRGPGTVCHIHNCADTDSDKRLWGWRQDKPFSNPKALQTLSFYDGKNWSTTSTISFLARLVRWQRVLHLNGRFFTTGKDAQSEKGVAGVLDRYTFRAVDFPYRVRRMTVSPKPGSKADWAIAAARLDTETGPPRRLIEFTSYDEGEDPETGGGGGGPVIEPGQEFVDGKKMSWHIFSYEVEAGIDLVNFQVADATNPSQPVKSWSKPRPGSLRHRSDWKGAADSLEGFEILGTWGWDVCPPAHEKVEILLGIPEEISFKPPIILRRS